MLVDPENACDYHLMSRCVQGAFLCGRDRRIGRDHSHRKQWLVDRIELLGCCFAVDVYAHYLGIHAFPRPTLFRVLLASGYNTHSDTHVGRTPCALTSCSMTTS